jgi:hypothetical protein
MPNLKKIPIKQVEYKMLCDSPQGNTLNKLSPTRDNIKCLPLRKFKTTH